MRKPGISPALAPRRSGSGGRPLLALWALVSLGAAPAAAQVLEIHADGSVVRHEGAQVYTTEAVISLAPVALASPAPETIGADPGRGIQDAIDTAAAAYGIDRRLLTAVAWRESGFRPEAVSPKGAVGLMQLTAGAASDVGVDRFVPGQNVIGGAAYLRRMLDQFGGDVTLALAAYNAGPRAVRRYGGVPPFAETRAYVAAVTARAGSTPNARTDLEDPR